MSPNGNPSALFPRSFLPGEDRNSLSAPGGNINLVGWRDHDGIRINFRLQALDHTFAFEFHYCERVANVFMLRELDEIESKEICAMLAISDSNLWVMLHRARMALRECLEINWFNAERGGELT